MENNFRPPSETLLVRGSVIQIGTSGKGGNSPTLEMYPMSLVVVSSLAHQARMVGDEGGGKGGNHMKVARQVSFY